MPIKVIIDSNNNTTSLFSSSKKRYIILNTGSTTSIATQDTYGVVRGSDSIIIENGRVKIAPSVLEDSFEGAAIKEWVIDQGYATSSWISSQDYASKTHLNQILEAYPTSADLNAIIAPYAAKEWVLNKFSSVWDDMPYATSTGVGGIKAHDTFVNGIRINNGFLEVDPSYADGGGHTFEDQSGTALPARSVAKAGAGIEFEDDEVGEMTVIRLKEYIQPISFAITDTFTFKPSFSLSITSADVSANISDLRVGKNGATPTTITYPYPIIASDVLTFEVSFTDAYNRELSSFITLKGQYV